MKKFTPGTKYKRKGGGYYIYHGITENGKIIAESNSKIFELVGKLSDHMIPEVFSANIWYTKIIYLKYPPCPRHSTTSLVDFLLGNQTGIWWTKKLPQFPVTVRVTVETIND